MAEFSNRSRSDVESEAECQSVWNNAGEVQTVPLQLDETNKWVKISRHVFTERCPAHITTVKFSILNIRYISADQTVVTVTVLSCEHGFYLFYIIKKQQKKLFYLKIFKHNSKAGLYPLCRLATSRPFLKPRLIYLPRAKREGNLRATNSRGWARAS